jgi:hypothetical protein
LPVGSEVLQDLQRRVRNELEIALSAHAPAALTCGLHEKDIVAVEVWSHAAARRGVAHHDVVEAGVWQEGELPKQACGVRERELHALDEKRPACPRQSSEIAR